MGDFVPVRRNRVSEEVVSQIQRLIYIGRFKPEERLPAERELCEALNVSRASLREALFVLQAMGYIHIQPRNGIYVKSPIPDSTPQPVRRMFRVDAEQFLNILEALEVIGPKVALLAAERAKPRDLEEMEETLRGFMECLETGAIYSSKLGRSYNTQLYMQLAQASGNPLLAHLMNFTIEFIKGPLPFSVEKLDERPEFANKIYEQIKELVHCISEGDSEGAERAVYAHFSFIKNCLEEVIE
jgi:GntR family transcriptional regulator, transcriptional repressor for pyruvate dehydrogenase complex